MERDGGDDGEEIGDELGLGLFLPGSEFFECGICLGTTLGIEFEFEHFFVGFDGLVLMTAFHVGGGEV